MTEPINDPESCSWCLYEVEDSDLIEADDGARCCPECVNNHPERFPTVTYICWPCSPDMDDPQHFRPTGRQRVRAGDPRGFDATALFELTCGHWTDGQD